MSVEKWGPHSGDPDGTGRLLAKTQTEYDDIGRPTVTYNLLDSGSFLPDEHHAPTENDPATRTWYTRAGQPWKIEDPEGNATLIEYDLLGRRTKVTDAKGNYVTYMYDNAGNLTQTISTELDADGSTSRTYVTRSKYDSLGRMIESAVDPDGLNLRTSYEYDARGNQIVVVDPEGHRTEKVYNDANQLLESRLCINGSTNCSQSTPDKQYEERVRYGYDINGLLYTQTDGNDNRTEFWYDQFDRKLFTRYPDNSGIAWLYDPGGRVTTIRHQQRLKADNGAYVPERHLNPNDDTANRCDGDDDCLLENITYDRLNRVTRKAFSSYRHPELYAGTTEQRFKYDGLSRVVETFDNNGDSTFNGDSASIDDVTVTRTYDTLSRLRSEAQKIGPIGGQITRTVSSTSYDKNGNRLHLAYPSGLEVDFEPDALNRLSYVKVGGATVAHNLYSGPGLVERREYGNGTVLEMKASDGSLKYDKAKRILEVKHDLNQTTGTPVVLNLQYGYDKDSLRLYERRVHESPDGSGYYPGQRYDHTFASGTRSAHRLEDFREGRLTEVGAFVGTATQQNTMTYDPEGNWTTLKVTGDSSPQPITPISSGKGSGMNQYHQFRDKTWDYTFKGDLTSDGTSASDHIYLYDRQSRLIQVTQGGSVVAKYSYDAENRRIEKRTYLTATDTVYVYDGWRVIDEFPSGDPSPTQQRYIWADRADKLLAFERLEGGSWKRYFVHGDALGSVRAVTDTPATPGNQTWRARFTYGSFGQLLTSTAQGAGSLNSCSTADCPMPYRYTGQRFDPESGLYYYKNRYYKPDAGRFLTRDPSGYSDGYNLYRYARNAATSTSDPTGLFSLQLLRLHGQSTANMSARDAKQTFTPDSVFDHTGELMADTDETQKNNLKEAVLHQQQARELKAAEKAAGMMTAPISTETGVVDAGFSVTPSAQSVIHIQPLMSPGVVQSSLESDNMSHQVPPAVSQNVAAAATILHEAGFTTVIDPVKLIDVPDSWHIGGPDLAWFDGMKAASVDPDKRGSTINILTLAGIITFPDHLAGGVTWDAENLTVIASNAEPFTAAHEMIHHWYLGDHDPDGFFKGYPPLVPNYGQDDVNRWFGSPPVFPIP